MDLPPPTEKSGLVQCCSGQVIPINIGPRGRQHVSRDHCPLCRDGLINTHRTQIEGTRDRGNIDEPHAIALDADLLDRCIALGEQALVPQPAGPAVVGTQILDIVDLEATAFTAKVSVKLSIKGLQYSRCS